MSLAAPRGGRPDAWRITGDRLAAAIMVGTALVYLLAVAHRPMVTTPESSYDDGLYLKLALHLVSGEWLGPYDGLTLAKGPGFPIFLALNYLAGLPVELALCLVYVAAAAYACLVLRRIVPSRAFGVTLFAALLFAPPLAAAGTTVVERDFFYAGLVLATIASFTDLALDAAISAKRPRIVILAGVLAGWTWLTREEGIWLAPPLLGLIALTLILRHGSDRLAALRRCLAALLIASLLVVGFGIINRIVYGRFEVNEIKSGPFAAAMEALERASYPDWRPYVPVPAAARQLIYAQSPTFRRLQPILDPPGSVNGWVAEGCGLLPQTCGDIAGGWFLWAFRAAADYLGVQGSPKNAQLFYSAVAAEVTAACEDGRLTCARWLPPMVPPFTRQQAVDFPATLLRAIGAVAMTQTLDEGWTPFPPPPTGVEAHDIEMIGAPTYGPGRVIELKGEYEMGSIADLDFTPWGNTQIVRIKSAAANGDQIAQEQRPSHLRSVSALVNCLAEPCGVTLSNGSGAEEDIDLVGPGQTRRNVVTVGQTVVTVDQDASTNYTLRTQLANRLNRMLPGLQKVYAALTTLGSLGLVISTICAIQRRRLSAALGLALVFGVAVTSRAGLIALVDATSFPAIANGYLAAAFPLVIAMSALALWSAANELFLLMRRRRATAPVLDP